MWLSLIVAAEPSYCDEQPMRGESVSYGASNNGHVLGAVRTRARVLPLRHEARCVFWSTPRIAEALFQLGLSVGNLSRATGGPIPWSRSHQSGRDADIAFFQEEGEAEDLCHFSPDLWSRECGVRFDVPRNWRMVRELITHPGLDIEYLFIDEALKSALLAYAAVVGTEESLLRRAEALLHPPSDAPPHDDHLHLRVFCTAYERLHGCRES